MMRTERILKFPMRPKCYMKPLKQYLNLLEKHPIVILTTEKQTILRFQDSIETVSKFPKLRCYLSNYHLNFSWILLPSEKFSQLEVVIQEKD